MMGTKRKWQEWRLSYDKTNGFYRVRYLFERIEILGFGSVRLIASLPSEPNYISAQTSNSAQTANATVASKISILGGAPNLPKTVKPQSSEVHQFRLNR